MHSYEVLKMIPGRYSYTTPSGKIDADQKWTTLAAKRAIELYEKWQKPELAGKSREAVVETKP